MVKQPWVLTLFIALLLVDLKRIELIFTINLLDEILVSEEDTRKIFLITRNAC